MSSYGLDHSIIHDHCDSYRLSNSVSTSPTMTPPTHSTLFSTASAALAQARIAQLANRINW